MNEKLISVLNEWDKWLKDKTKPNKNRKYSRCPICDRAWWGDKDTHEIGCHVPRHEMLLERINNND